jgi:membrane protease YdiL (CAAX protease family)
VEKLKALLIVTALMPWPLLAGPDNWWAYVLATAAIAMALRLLIGPRWPAAAGLDLKPGQALLTVIAFMAVASASAMLLPFVYRASGLAVEAPGIREQIGFLFQALNEEILFRALLIGFLMQYLRSAPGLSLGTALLYAAAHFLLYRYSNPMHFALSPTALATLFLAGVAMNNLYLAFRHVGFSWALHAGWNVMWLPATFTDAASGTRLAEPQVFDRVLGAPMMAALAGAIAVLTFAPLARAPIATAPDLPR